MSAVGRDMMIMVFGALDGAEVAGDCPDCVSVQKVTPVVTGVWKVATGHEDTCPSLGQDRPPEPATPCCERLNPSRPDCFCARFLLAAADVRLNDTLDDFPEET